MKHFPIEENPKRFIYYLLTNPSINLQVRDLLIFIYSYRNLIYLFPVLALLEHKLYWGEGIRLSLIHNVPLYVPVMSCTINVTSFTHSRSVGWSVGRSVGQLVGRSVSLLFGLSVSLSIMDIKDNASIFAT